ncbi:MAG: hypothetical protein ACFFCS_09180 [Candidatus Hodarchaeota archaeon]
MDHVSRILTTHHPIAYILKYRWPPFIPNPNPRHGDPPNVPNPAYFEALPRFKHPKPTIWHCHQVTPFDNSFGAIQDYDNWIWNPKGLGPGVQPGRLVEKVQECLAFVECVHEHVPIVVPYTNPSILGGLLETRGGFWRWYDAWGDYSGYGFGPPPDKSEEITFQRGPTSFDPWIPPYVKDFPFLRYEPCLLDNTWQRVLTNNIRLAALAGHDGVFVDDCIYHCTCDKCEKAFSTWLQLVKYPGEPFTLKDSRTAVKTWLRSIFRGEIWAAFFRRLRLAGSRVLRGDLDWPIDGEQDALRMESLDFITGSNIAWDQALTDQRHIISRRSVLLEPISLSSLRPLVDELPPESREKALSHEARIQDTWGSEPGFLIFPNAGFQIRMAGCVSRLQEGQWNRICSEEAQLIMTETTPPEGMFLPSIVLEYGGLHDITQGSARSHHHAPESRGMECCLYYPQATREAAILAEAGLYGRRVTGSPCAAIKPFHPDTYQEYIDESVWFHNLSKGMNPRLDDRDGGRDFQRVAWIGIALITDQVVSGNLFHLQWASQLYQAFRDCHVPCAIIPIESRDGSLKASLQCTLEALNVPGDLPVLLVPPVDDELPYPALKRDGLPVKKMLVLEEDLDTDDLLPLRDGNSVFLLNHLYVEEVVKHISSTTNPGLQPSEKDHLCSLASSWLDRFPSVITSASRTSPGSAPNCIRATCFQRGTRAELYLVNYGMSVLGAPGKTGLEGKGNMDRNIKAVLPPGTGASTATLVLPGKEAIPLEITVEHGGSYPVTSEFKVEFWGKITWEGRWNG